MVDEITLPVKVMKRLQERMAEIQRRARRQRRQMRALYKALEKRNRTIAEQEDRLTIDGDLGVAALSVRGGTATHVIRAAPHVLVDVDEQGHTLSVEVLDWPQEPTP